MRTRAKQRLAELRSKRKLTRTEWLRLEELREEEEYDLQKWEEKRVPAIPATQRLRILQQMTRKNGGKLYK